MVDALQIIDIDDASIQSTAGASLRPVSGVRRRAVVLAVGRVQSRLDHASQAAADAKGTLRQIRKAIDPREVAGGYAGLTAGEMVGGAVGGVAGAAVGGPAGAVVGAEVGAFTVGMLGLKLGMDAVGDYLKPKDDDTALKQDTPADPGRKGIVDRVRDKAGERRIGEIVGLTSGATLGLVIAGPAGGLLGAVLGETLGGRVGANVAKLPAENDVSSLPKPGERASQWLDRFGKKTAGEATTVLVAGSVGSLLGPSGIKVGQRVGRIVGQRIEWDKLGKPVRDENLL
jgi:outer membrane lipoprotein SlyB